MKFRIFIGLVIVAGFAAGLIWYIQSGTTSGSTASTSEGSGAVGGSSSGAKPIGGNGTEAKAVALGSPSTSRTSVIVTPPVDTNAGSNAGPNNAVAVVSNPANGASNVSPNGQSASGGAGSVKGLNLAAVPTAVIEYANANTASLSARSRVPVENIKLEPGIPIYDFSMTLRQSGGLNDVPFDGRYYFLADGPNGLIGGFAVVERFSSTGAPQSYSGTTWYAQINTGLQNLTMLPQVQAGSYEPRLALISGVVEAIWLKSLTDGNDLFYVYHKTITRAPLEMNTLLPAADFMAAVSTMIQAQASVGTGSRGGGRGG